jgi:competence protein ComEC
MKNFRKHSLWYAVVMLLFANVFIWQSSFERPRDGKLTVAMLDIGQGDAIYIEGPTGVNMIVDGGPTSKIVTELPKVMPFGERKIDAIVVTNPDSDHYAGFLDVLKKYDVGLMFEPGTHAGGATYSILKKEAAAENIPILLAKRGMKFDMGGGAMITVLFPDRDVSNFSTNDGSIIMRLDYGSTSVMFTGDTTKIIEAYMVNHYPEDLPATVLKVAHHGSKTSSYPAFVEAVSPKYAIMSLAAHNTYGFPHKPTLDTLSKFNVELHRTDLESTIIMHSDGKNFTFQ